MGHSARYDIEDAEKGSGRRREDVDLEEYPGVTARISLFESTCIMVSAGGSV